DTLSAHATRQHNNANILTMGQRVVGTGLALDIVKTFLSSEFEGDRHSKRINKITAIEEKYGK
ncbi:MAG: RpiB/LacA/LacB family sugar-phosphate isomerase, partial [Clostridium butyricum]|nr:RpiB/LacA/LacB family sugar-phosphate isomerase [Clostridium butyricum]